MSIYFAHGKLKQIIATLEYLNKDDTEELRTDLKIVSIGIKEYLDLLHDVSANRQKPSKEADIEHRIKVLERNYEFLLKEVSKLSHWGTDYVI